MHSRDESQLPASMETENGGPAASAASASAASASAASASAAELEHVNGTGDNGDNPLLIFSEDNLKQLQRRTEELKTERSMQKNKFKWVINWAE